MQADRLVVCLRGAIDYALSGEHAGVRRLGRSLYLATRYLWCPNNRGTVSGGECRKYDSVNLVTQYAFRHHCATTCRVDSQGCEPPPPPRARAPSPGRAISSPPPYAERPQCTLGPWALRTLACYLARSGAPTFPLLLLYHPPCRRWNLSTNTGARTTQHSIDAGTWM